jgi:hypothetical protein
MMLWGSLLAASFAGGAGYQWRAGRSGRGAAEAHPGAPAEVRAQAFILVDGNGQELARLGQAPQVGQPPGPFTGLIVKDADGHDRVAVGVTPTDTRVGVLDQQGRLRLSVAISPDDTDVGLEVVDHNGKRCLTLGVDPAGAGLRLWDAQNRKRGDIRISPEGTARIATFDAAGREVWPGPFGVPHFEFIGK